MLSFAKWLLVLVTGGLGALLNFTVATAGGIDGLTASFFVLIGWFLIGYSFLMFRQFEAT